ncbi:metallophosphoesterase [Staphylospora marina]|uniref:metallophosphoesterase n=1 Tax=Staphylospora marina TaxID=2490858 RepID=UPI000F5C00B0|nr:metallophosphoesterase [Staphylospora marina]
MSKAGTVLAVAVISALYAGVNVYVGRKLLVWLRLLFPDLNGTAFTIIYACFALSFVTAILPLPSSVKGIMSWTGSYWLGLFVYLLLFFLATDLILFLGKLLKIIPVPTPLHVQFIAGLIVLLATAGFVSYGLYNANQIKHVSYDIRLNKSADMKIVLISDLHLGAVNSEKRLSDMVKKINALQPDLVAMAGDIFNDDYHAIKDPERASELLRSIQTKYGVYACLGNHDSGKTFDQMVGFLERSNIKLLNDDSVTIDDKLVLFGRVDPSPIGGFGGLSRKEIKNKIAAVNPELPIVVMDHTPANLEQYGNDVDLILSGHTHRGQIFPFNFVTNAIFEVDYGYYRRGDAGPHVIVTSGVGTWGMPMRVGSNSEIVSIHLH